MDKDTRLMYENYVDGITKKKSELSGNIMDIVKHGIPSKEQFIAIRAELHRFTKEIQDRGTGATEQEKEKAHHLMGQIRAYRSQHPDDPGPYAEEAEEADDAASTHMHVKQQAREQDNPPHGYPGGVTAVQNMLMTQLNKRGFVLNKISDAHAEQDGYVTVFMHKKQGPMHTMAEIDGMGMINGEPYKEYMQHLKTKSEDEETAEQRIMAAKMAVAQAKGQIAQAKTQGQMKHYGDGLTNALGKPEQAEGASISKHGINKFHAKLDALVHDTFGKRKSENAEGAKPSYNAMTHLTQAANQIRDILQTHADDEAQVEHVIRMAQIILGPKSDHTDAEYRKMLDGLIIILNRFIIVPMN